MPTSPMVLAQPHLQPQPLNESRRSREAKRKQQVNLRLIVSFPDAVRTGMMRNNDTSGTDAAFCVISVFPLSPLECVCV